MKVSFENPDKINGLMTITVEEEDYKNDVEKTLKDYRKQLLDLHEATQRRTVKPRVITVERKCVTKVTVTDPATQQLEILKCEVEGLQKRIAAMTAERDGKASDVKERA